MQLKIKKICSLSQILHNRDCQCKLTFSAKNNYVYQHKYLYEKIIAIIYFQYRRGFSILVSSGRCRSDRVLCVEELIKQKQNRSYCFVRKYTYSYLIKLLGVESFTFSMNKVKFKYLKYSVIARLRVN